MIMKKQIRADGKWYENVPRRHRHPSMIPNVSRPTSRISKVSPLQNSLQEADWVSLGGPRSSSRASGVFDSPGTSYSFRRRRTSQGNIDDILSKHQIVRPRSVSLVKYDPLPAINSGSGKGSRQPSGGTSSNPESPKEDVSEEFYSSSNFGSENSSKLGDSFKISTIEEHEVEDLHHSLGKDEIIDAVQEPTATVESEEEQEIPGPPKLVRSRTFEVIETNLTNLPVIDDSQQCLQVDQAEPLDGCEENWIEIRMKSPSKHISKVEVKVCIDGLPLNTFINQPDSDSLSLSPLSLVTHPGSPKTRNMLESGLVDTNTEATSTKEMVVTDMEETEEEEEEEESSQEPPTDITPLQSKIVVKLPDDSKTNLRCGFNVTLQDFLNSLQSLEWDEKQFIIVEDVEERYLEEPLTNFHFKNNTDVQLLLQSSYPS